MNIHALYSRLTRRQKKSLFVALDLIFIPVGLYLSFVLRLSDLWPKTWMEPFWWMFILMSLAGVYIHARLGLYRAVVRFVGHQFVMAVFKAVALNTIVLYAMAQLSGQSGFPRSIPIIFAMISVLYVTGSRYLVKSYYQNYIHAHGNREPLLIYGAGGAGMRLSLSLAGSKEFFPIAFIDDDSTLHGGIVNGLTVYPPDEIHKLIQRYSIKSVVLALPAASRKRRSQIIDRLKKFTLRVLTLPSLAELAAGTSGYAQLHEVELDDLLGRDAVVPDEVLLAGSITGKVVMVTGAGGSIGAELCRQIARLRPAKLVMFDNSEFALYAIDYELSQQTHTENGAACNYVAVLGSVLNTTHVASVISRYSVNTLFHAAAYKHVPLLEDNVLEAVKNNIFGTRTVAEAALRHGVERFILVSTDKAVRPTSVMGATKRTAEQVVQTLADSSHSTIFSIVRFGNVLGSSGSVVPLFRKQIEHGGPVTVTHEDVTRYFMSIPEAAQLVIQAASLAAGGDVFVLDMGQPVRIFDLAKNMIELSGLRVRDQNNPDGDVEIVTIGLRPGEKLHEELLLGDNVVYTQHPRIMRASEEHLGVSEMRDALSRLAACIDDEAPDLARTTLQSVVTGFMATETHVEFKEVEGDGYSPT